MRDRRSFTQFARDGQQTWRCRWVQLELHRCRACGESFWLCALCAKRGYAFCGGDCGDAHRRQQAAVARRTYQQSPEGRADHRDRQREFRARRRIQRQRSVMDQSSENLPTETIVAAASLDADAMEHPAKTAPKRHHDGLPSSTTNIQAPAKVHVAKDQGAAPCCRVCNRQVNWSRAGPYGGRYA